MGDLQKRAHLSLSYFKRCGFIFLQYYSEILVILQKMSPPPLCKAFSFLFLDHQNMSPPHPNALFLSKETCDIHCVASCLPPHSHPGCFCSALCSQRLSSSSLVHSCSCYVPRALPIQLDPQRLTAYKFSSFSPWGIRDSFTGFNQGK